jgi:hypothetical protein
LIASAAKKGNRHDYSELVAGVISLHNNCSVKAKNALMTIAESKRFKEYIEYESKFKFSENASSLLSVVEECIGSKQ